MRLELDELEEGCFVLVKCGEYKADTVYVPSITDEQLKAIYEIIGYDENSRKILPSK